MLFARFSYEASQEATELLKDFANPVTPINVDEEPRGTFADLVLIAMKSASQYEKFALQWITPTSNIDYYSFEKVNDCIASTGATLPLC